MWQLHVYVQVFLTELKCCIWTSQSYLRILRQFGVDFLRFLIYSKIRVLIGRTSVVLILGGHTFVCISLISLVAEYSGESNLCCNIYTVSFWHIRVQHSRRVWPNSCTFSSHSTVNSYFQVEKYTAKVKQIFNLWLQFSNSKWTIIRRMNRFSTAVTHNLKLVE